MGLKLGQFHAFPEIVFRLETVFLESHYFSFPEHYVFLERENNDGYGGKGRAELENNFWKK